MGGKGSGRPRKPTAQKIAEGNRGKRPLNLREPKALPGEPDMPSGMTEQARAVWPEVVAMLKANDVLFKTDGLAVMTLCSNLVLFWKADKKLEQFDMNVTDTRIRSDAEKKLRACWQLFGLDPSSRPDVQTSNSADRHSSSALDAVMKIDKDEIIH
jgi:phage terminase small subunit